jgi:hypothetical protein
MLAKQNALVPALKLGPNNVSSQSGAAGGSEGGGGEGGGEGGGGDGDGGGGDGGGGKRYAWSEQSKPASWFMPGNPLGM